MFRIDGIGNNSNYRVNPVYLRYAEKYETANKEYEKYESKIKNGNAEKIDFIKLEKAKQEKIKYKNTLYSTPKVIFGGNLDKVSAEVEAKKLHKIDFLA